MMLPPDAGKAGFTLIEMAVVLAMLGFIAALTIGRGPMRSEALEAKAAASEIAGALRLARGRAIATNHTVTFVVNEQGFQVEGSPPQRFRPGLTASVAAMPDPLRQGGAGVIRFAPDGSSSGGKFGLLAGQRRYRIGVAWLTGRVSIADAQ